MNSFKEKVVLITGASSGIGKELAFQLADQGSWLALGARNQSKLEEVATECKNRGGKALIIPTDVAQQEECEQLIKLTLEKYGRIDVLVNNAGITMTTYFDQIQDISMTEKIMQVNYFGSVYCTYYALPHLKKSKGLIVGVSSLTGKTGVPTRTAYAASKHAQAGFFDSLRIELMGTGVGVTMIYPGFVSTPIRENALRGDGQPLGKDPVAKSDAMTVEECARIIVKAMAKRQREVVMTIKGKLAGILKVFAPSLVDKLAKKAVEG